MKDLFKLILGVLASLFKSRAKLEAEILILRQQINVLRRRASKRPHLNNTDRFLFVWLYHWFPSVLGAIAIVRPETIIRWLSLSQTLSGWQLIENQAILLWDEGSLQTYWLDGRRSAPVAGNARGRDLDVAAANKRPAADCSKETLLQYHRSIDIRWSLSIVP